ncbi:hypothetical protein KVR01_006409 [Diaporthe batatas]|uniref:uncharacterized protein n=1 Tax=Diaporthe batatas TaxID=748121 RepID=UPI001D04A4D4|nr:uncharacterized protein KVR01_006409 [Diaporthe batatas]KAG8164491.1 hypothetical protein KVR01_006409 [Diaporthe batatas]
MGLLHIATFFLALASTAVSFPTWNDDNVQNDSVVVESLVSPPLGWVKDETKQFDKEVIPIRLRIHLSHQNMDKFHEIALRVATPGNHQYGAHMPQKAIDDLIVPRDETRNLVMDWLESAGHGGNATYSARGDSIIVSTSIARAERLLDAEYNAYRNTETNEVVLRTLQFSLPGTLTGHIEMVQPTTFFGFRAFRSSISRLRVLSQEASDAMEQSAGSVDGCTGFMTPPCLASLYDFKSAGNYTTGLLGIAGFLEEYAAPFDLQRFLSKYSVPGSDTSQNFTCVGVNGGSCPTGPEKAGSEASLDVQYARAIAGSIPITYYSTAGRGKWVGDGVNTNEPFVEFLDYLLAEADPLPNTLSISYGDVDSTMPDSYARHVCDLFSQLGARGVSVLVASGDWGVGTTKDCTTKDGHNQFSTLFPASCPWVTTVGGTTFTNPEFAWTSGGGGFSNLFPRPSYQDKAVESWLASGTADAMRPYFNASGRAYPDVAAQAQGFAIVNNGIVDLVSGTSASAPTFAAIIQLVNSDRIAKGKPALGFLNPWLYANASSSPALTDVTKGGIIGCGSKISGAGFDAVSGWDPATGLGTPVFTGLLALSDEI